MGHAHGLRTLHAGKLRDHVVDLYRGDICAAGLDHVGQPPFPEKAPVRIDIPAVARAEIPFCIEAVLRALAEVARHQRRPLDAHLAFLANGHHAPGQRLDDLERIAGKRRAEASAEVFVLGVRSKRGADRHRLGRAEGHRYVPVGVDRRVLPYLLAARYVLEAGKVGAVPAIGSDEPRPLVRAAIDERDALRLDQAQRLVRVEPALQDHRAAGRERCAQHHRDVAGPEEAVARPTAHRLAHGEDARPAPPLHGESTLRVDDALGEAGRARGEEYAARVGRVHRIGAREDLLLVDPVAACDKSLPRLACTTAFTVDAHEVLQKRKRARSQCARSARCDLWLEIAQHRVEIGLEDLPLVDQQRNLRGFEQVIELRSRRECAERHRHCAGQRDTEQAGKELGPVGHQDAHARVLTDPRGNKCLGNGHRLREQLVVAPRQALAAIVGDDRLGSAVARHDFAQVARDGVRPLALFLCERRACDQRQVGRCQRSSPGFVAIARALASRLAAAYRSGAAVTWLRACRQAARAYVRAQTGEDQWRR